MGLGPGYWRLWTASVVSNLGDGVSLVAYPWLAGTLTRDPVAIAAVTLATRLPWLLVSLPAGAIVDRVDRARLMVAMNAARAVLTGGVAVAVLTGVMTLQLLCASALLLGIAEVLYDNAAQSILPRIVAADRLERANANLWSAEDIAGRLAGPPLGGFLIGAGLAVPFLFDAGSFAVSAALIMLIANAAKPLPAEAPAERGSLRSEIARASAGCGGTACSAHLPCCSAGCSRSTTSPSRPRCCSPRSCSGWTRAGSGCCSPRRRSAGWPGRSSPRS